ncbi:hypothetical protein VTK26DRAFT_449 [Humicola hyalothermophila]
MWRNQEVQRFTEWLRGWNRDRDPREPGAVGFYGLDLYSLGRSMREVIAYLERVDRGMAEVARERYARMMVWAEDPHEYGLEALASGFRGCEEEVVRMLKDLLARRLEYVSRADDGEEFHGGEQNARLVKDAEQYYKAMYYGRDESWNLRDKHMFDTLVRVLKHRGQAGPARAVVWAHNSHVGDARATSMGWARDELNIGQLCKETFGREAVSIGCSGNTGTVAAARRWDGDMQVMQVRPGLPNSYEHLMHSTGVKSFALDLREGHCDAELRKELLKKRLERFIGVIYAPHTERQSHYSHAVLPEQFDGLVWFDETRHVGALEVHQPHVPLEYDETWPFGLCYLSVLLSFKMPDKNPERGHRAAHKPRASEEANELHQELIANEFGENIFGKNIPENPPQTHAQRRASLGKKGAKASAEKEHQGASHTAHKSGRRARRASSGDAQSAQPRKTEEKEKANVIRGLKSALKNPHVSEKAKEADRKKLEELGETL